ncbi:unnamed protein product [Heligmosomoides polygyrus]|uniref:LTD domain-containing protein n=1 Tax=Heligmosomoides polygyrus TaxID=6339 RepID=A0A183FNC6_HELPZ|nr:unnamed protein product [Heligmosomoides polygyrus]
MARTDVRNIRGAENREIGVLNDRHADYISEVHFLQAIHRKLEMHIQKWSSSAAFSRTVEQAAIGHIRGLTSYDADAEQLPGLSLQLSSMESRLEAALHDLANLDEDALLVKLCDIRMKLGLAEGRGRRIEEECRRLRMENQKLIEDQAEQRRTQVIEGYSFDDIESDRKHFRSAVESAMVDIRHQYDQLASTVGSEMKQWYDEKVVEIGTKFSSEAKSQKNRLLESLIADIEDVRSQDLISADHLVKEDEQHLRTLMERYETIVSAPAENEYTIATLRAEIMRYRELLEGIGSRSNRDGSVFRSSGFHETRIVHSSSSAHEIGSGVRIHSGSAYQTQIGSGAVSLPRMGSGAYSQIGSGASYSQIGSGAGAAYTTQIRTTSTAHSQIGSGAAPYSQTGSGAETTFSQAGSSVRPQIGYGVTTGTTDIGSGALYQSETYSTSSAIDRQPTVVSTLDYTIKEAPQTTVSSRISTEHDYSMHRSAQGNVTIGEVAADGSYITLENTSLDSDQHLGGWTLRSTSSSLKQVSYTFPRDFTLTPMNTVRVFAKGQGAHNPPHSVVCETDTSFATGEDLSVYLYDTEGQVNKFSLVDVHLSTLYSATGWY